MQVGSFEITIENPAGSKRSGRDADGKEWETTMTHSYGYIRGTESADGDPFDVFISSDIDGWNRRKVYVVDQYNPDGTFDEHKVMLGFNDKDNASRLNYKATAARHDFDLSELKSMVQSLQHPLAVIEYGDSPKAQNIILEVVHNGKNFVVGLSLRPTVKGPV